MEPHGILHGKGPSRETFFYRHGCLSFTRIHIFLQGKVQWSVLVFHSKYKKKNQGGGLAAPSVPSVFHETTTTGLGPAVDYF